MLFNLSLSQQKVTLNMTLLQLLKTYLYLHLYHHNYPDILNLENADCFHLLHEDEEGCKLKKFFGCQQHLCSFSLQTQFMILK